MARKNTKETVEEEPTKAIVKIDLTGTKDFDYDQWLEFFRTKTTAGVLIDNLDILKYEINPDGYAALMRWMEIFNEPSRMDKLYKGRLSKTKTEDVDIMEIAVGDNDEEFYIALIQQNTAQLNSSNVSQQEVARLTTNINIFRKELRDIRSRTPKAGSLLQKVLDEAAKGPVKKAPVSRKKTTKKPKATTVKKSVKNIKAPVKNTKKSEQKPKAKTTKKVKK